MDLLGSSNENYSYFPKHINQLVFAVDTYFILCDRGTGDNVIIIPNTINCSPLGQLQEAGNQKVYMCIHEKVV
jgi:hypothetical protein